MNRNEQKELVSRAQAGDRSAFEALYNENMERVYAFAKRNLGSDDAARDVAAETFASALEHIGELRSGESFIGWLYSIAYSKCADRLRENSRTEHFETDSELEKAVQDQALNEPIMLPDDYAVNAETKRLLGEIIDSLSPDQRSAVILYYYDELSIPEVAKALGTNENNTRQKLHKARGRIRKQVEKLIGKGAMFAAVPLGAVLNNTADASYARAAVSGAARVKRVGLGIKITAIGAAATVAVGVPIALHNTGGGDYRPEDLTSNAENIIVLTESDADSSAPDITDESGLTEEEKEQEALRLAKMNELTPAFSDLKSKQKYFERNYPGKKQLIWLCESTPKHEIEINNYLYEHGFDYVVCFRDVREELGDDDLHTLKAGETILDSNDQVDIVTSFSQPFGEELYSNSYYRLIEKGYLEPLNEMIGKQEYQEYYDLMPGKYWEACSYNGKLYGIDNQHSSLAPDSGYNVYEEKLRKCGIAADDLNKPLDELRPMLEKISKETGLVMYVNDQFLTNNFVFGEYITESIIIRDGKAVCVFDLPEVKEHYELINGLREDGLAIIDNPMISMIALESASMHCGYGTKVTNTQFDNTSVFYSQAKLICSPYSASGVAAKSKNKEEAFDLLMHLFFDKELNTVAAYGTEGVFYKLREDGWAEMLPNSFGNIGFPCWELADQGVCLPCFNSGEPAYAGDVYKAYVQAEFAEGFGEYYDLSEYAKELKACADVQQEFSSSAIDITVDEKLNDLRIKLKGAGIDKIITAINERRVTQNEENDSNADSSSDASDRMREQ